MPTNPDNRPVSELFSDALNQFSKLVRNEIELARAEFAAKAQQAIAGIGLLAGAAVFLIPSVVLLLMALASLLAEVMPAALANLLAAVAGFVIVAILAWTGINRLKAETLVPNRTLGQLQRDAAAAKELV